MRNGNGSSNKNLLLTKLYYIRMDAASLNKLASVLLQIQNNVEVPICFSSWVTKSDEKDKV